MSNFLIPGYIVVCDICGNQALRPGYPCARCGGSGTLTFVPLDREAWQRAREQSVVAQSEKDEAPPSSGSDAP